MHTSTAWVCANSFSQVDFETPRKSYSTAWKGLINDPHISGSTQINKGLMYAAADDDVHQGQW